MRNVLLVNVCAKNDTVIEQTGICSIAAYLRREGMNVILTYVKDGSNEEEFWDKINLHRPEVVAFNVHYQGVFFLAELVKCIRKELPMARICVGGYVATYYAKELFQMAPDIDYVMRREGEVVCKNLCEAENADECKKIKGISYMQNGELVENPDEELIEDLDDLPFIARDLLEQIGTEIVSMSTSRGCTRNCSFCSSPGFWKSNRQWRGRTPSLVVDEMEYICKTYKKNNFDFIDASFEDPDVNFSRLREIANEIVDRKLTIVYTACFRVSSVIRFDKELMDLLYQSGLRNIFLGVESANSDDLKLYNKVVSYEDICKAIEVLRNHKFNVEIGFINFNPYSNFDGLRQNFVFLHKYGYTTFLTNIKKLRLYRGCTILDRIKKDNLLIDGESKFISDYKFIDDRIQKLYNSLNQFMNHDMSQHQFFKYFQYYSIYFREYLEGLIVNRIDEDFVRSEAEKLTQLLKDFAEVNYQWYTTLLDYAEKGMGEMELFEYTIKTLYADEVVDILKKLHHLKQRLFLKYGTEDKAFTK